MTAPWHGLPRSWWVGLLLLHLLPFLTRPALIGGDEPHYALAAHSLAVDGDLALEDDYAAVEAGSNAAGRKRAGTVLDRHLRETAAGPVFAHPIGLPLLAAPLLWAQHLLAPGSSPDLALGLLTLAVTFCGWLAGAHLLARRATDPRLGALVALAVYFASPLWFYGRTFLTEPYIVAFCLLGLAALGARRFGAAAVCFFLALAMKETAALVVGPIVLAALVRCGWRRAWPLLAAPGAFATFFVAKNLALGQPPLATFQPYQATGSLEGLIGFLVDPSRGLLWFAPLLLAACAGWPRLFRQDRLVAATAATLVLSSFLLAAFWIDWRGGSCYGPRLILPVLPALALPLLALVESRPSWPLRSLLGAALVAGFTINGLAAVRPVTAFWSAAAGGLVLDHPATALALAALAASAIWRLGRSVHPEHRDLLGRF